MNNFRLVSAALFAAMAATGSALAADMPLPLPPIVVPVCIWCGWYVGLNGGYNWGTADVTFTPTGFFSQDLNSPFFTTNGSPTFHPRKFSGGGQVGWNSQWGPMMAGIEADVEYIGLRATRATSLLTAPILLGPPLNSPAEQISFDEDIKNDWVTTWRLRLGWTNDYMLIYGTGGIALSRPSFSQTFTIQNFNGGVLQQGETLTVTGGGSVTKFLAGFAAGGGAEVKLTSDWSLRAEYLFIDLGKAEFDATLVCTSGCTPSTTPVGFTTHHEERMQTNIVRAAINYQFPVAAPVAAPLIVK
jgi:outer membrane immunogenic protein